VPEQAAEDRVGIRLAHPPEAQRGAADRLDPAVRARGPVEAQLAERGEQLEADRDPLLPAQRRLTGAGNRVERQAAPEQQRVAHPHALVPSLGEAELGAQRLPGGQQVAPRA